jgi:Xaa-Pro aminopeptidase
MLPSHRQRHSRRAGALTVEPRIYIPNLGGVRVEENVAVTKGGVDVLTAYPRELRFL